MKIQLQSILLPCEAVCTVQELYFHEKDDRADFDGYFNLFYIEKRKAYTNIAGLYLTARIMGYSRLILMHNREKIREMELNHDQKEYVVEFPYQEYSDGVFWFSLIKRPGEVKQEISGYYAGEISDEYLQPVNIGIDICTYRREPYVLRNLMQLKEKILDNEQLDAAAHIRIYVIDNGKTLKEHAEICELVKKSDGRICILENRNAGGVGGFTRGMMEVMNHREEYGMTHVLLMDDDAVIEPDAVMRTYGLLATRKEEWKKITVGGGIMRQEFPHILFCAGEMWKDGFVINPRKNLDVRDYQTACCSYLTETGHEHEWYSGWWYCCYSLETVRPDNLPLPVFIHGDDIEFCLRNRNQGIVFLNGITVWHRSFDLTLPGANHYYDLRNVLICLVLLQDEVKKKALKFVMRSLTSAVIRLRYEDAELVYRGFLDFLKGPQWLIRQDPNELNQKIRQQSAKKIDPEEAFRQLDPEEADSLYRQIQDYQNRFGMDQIARAKTVQKPSILQALTFNGWLMPENKRKIYMVSVLDSPWAVFRKNKVFCYEPGSGKGVMTERDYHRIGRMIGLYIKSWIAFRKYFDPACERYRKQFKQITNQKFWEEYLKEK